MLPARQRRTNLGRNELRARRDEERRFGGRREGRVGVQEQVADAVAGGRAAGLAEQPERDSSRGEPRREPTELGRLPRALAALEHHEPPARHLAHPSVMMELVAPRLIPSRIH